MSKLDDQLADGRIMANLPQYRGKETALITNVCRFIDRIESPYLSLSWGKQSIILAHVVAIHRPHTLCVHWTGEDAEFLGDFMAVKEAFMGRWPLNYLEWPRALSLKEAIAEYDNSHHHGGQIVGIAAEESKGRMALCKTLDHGRCKLLADGRSRCYPMAWWTVADLAAYIAKYELPLLSPYRRFGLEVRTSTGCKPGSYTERALDLMNSTDAAEMRDLWRQRGLA